MSAKEMFEKLGYKKNEVDESIYWEQPAIFELGEHTPYVSFDLVNKKWHTNIVNVEKDKSLIRAINKQVEEWGAEPNKLYYVLNIISVEEIC